jgi:hypothetical protein
MSYWRSKAAAVITQAIAEGKAQGLEDKELKKFVNKRYPFGMRQYHPYKIWLDEMNKQLATPKSSTGKLEMNRATNWEQLP